MAELKLGGRAKHSFLYINMLRGNARKKAEAADYEIIFLNEVSVKVRPWGSTQKYGTQFPRRYMLPVEEERKVIYVCRFCQQEAIPDSTGVKEDIDNVTGEKTGYYHDACLPGSKSTGEITISENV